MLNQPGLWFRNGSPFAERDMASRFLHCQQSGPILIGTTRLQACPASQGGREGPGSLAPSCAHWTLRLREQREGQPMSLQAPPLRTFSESAGWNGEERLVKKFGKHWPGGCPRPWGPKLPLGPVPSKQQRPYMAAGEHPQRQTE